MHINDVLHYVHYSEWSIVVKLYFFELIFVLFTNNYFENSNIYEVKMILNNILCCFS